MISRRLLRIKVLQGIYAYQRDGEMELDQALKMLKRSIEEVHDLYLHILSFPAQMQTYLESESEAESEKYFPNQETLRAANIFRSNEVVEKIEKALEGHPKKHLKGLDWKNNGDFMLSLFPVLRMQSFVRDYLVFDDPTFEQKRDFMKQFFNFLFFEHKPFKDVAQEDYLNWKVDMNPVRKAIIRTISSLNEGDEIEIAPLSNSEELDMEFANNLMSYTIKENDSLEDLLASNTPNWDVDRIAAVDFILLKMGIIEFTRFPDVPVKVTINEYLEISKDFSTPNSSRFVNGVLDKLRIRLTNEGAVVKQGRGLWQ